MAALDDGADLVIGSRYTAGGGVRDWGLARRVVSRGGSIFARHGAGAQPARPDGRLQGLARGDARGHRLVARPLGRLRLPDRDDVPRAAAPARASSRCPSSSPTAGWARARCRAGSSWRPSWSSCACAGRSCAGGAPSRARRAPRGTPTAPDARLPIPAPRGRLCPPPAPEESIDALPGSPVRVTIVAANPFEHRLALPADGHDPRAGRPRADDPRLVGPRACRSASSSRPACRSCGSTSTAASAPRCGRCRPRSAARVSRVLGLDPEATVLPPEAPTGLDRLRHPLRRLLEVVANARRAGPWTDAVVAEAPDTDVFHAQSLICLPVVRGAARRTGGRFVYDVADYHTEAARLARMPGFVRAIVRRRERGWARDAAAFLAVSDPVADLVCRSLGRAAPHRAPELPARLAPGGARARRVGAHPRGRRHRARPAHRPLPGRLQRRPRRGGARRPRRPTRASWTSTRPSCSWAMDDSRRSSGRPRPAIRAASTSCRRSRPTSSCPGRRARTCPSSGSRRGR